MEIDINTNKTMDLNIFTIIEQNIILQILLCILIIISFLGYILSIHLIYTKFLKKNCKCINPIDRIKRKKDLILEMGTLEHNIKN